MAGAASGQRTVLLISDDMSDRAAIKSSLEKNNVSVLISENWQQCLPSVPYINPDLILLNIVDKNLSEEDRSGICRKLKEQKETKDIPLIVVVGSREGRSILEAGAEDFIVSPIKSEELAARVRVYLENHYLKKLLQDSRTGDRVHRAGVLLSDMSHDIRTRLNAIIGFTELLEQDRSLTADHYEKLDTIRRNGTHLSLLIDDLVEICRLETGRSTLNMTSFGLEAFVRDIEKVTGQRNNGLQCDATTDATGDAIRVIVADRERLMRAIMNLIDHSVKAGKNSVVCLRLYTVRDTGGFKLIGEIYPGREDRSGELANSSQASKRTPERIAADGMRHGLVLGRELLRCLGGTVEVTSDSEGRDCIHFELIVREGSIRPIEIDLAHGSLVGSGNPEAIRVLVADDAEENCIVFRAILEHMGFEVRSVENGEEAVRQYDDWNPHIIMMDLRMPGMDGYEAARMIRTRQGGADALIFAATGDATDSDREKIRESGMDGFILKPYDEDTVRKKIEEFVRIRMASGRKDSDGKQTHAPCDTMAISEVPHGIVDKMQEAARNARLDILLQIVDEAGAYNASLAGSLRGTYKEI